MLKQKSKTKSLMPRELAPKASDTTESDEDYGEESVTDSASENSDDPEKTGVSETELESDQEAEYSEDSDHELDFSSDEEQYVAKRQRKK